MNVYHALKLLLRCACSKTANSVFLTLIPSSSTIHYFITILGQDYALIRKENQRTDKQGTEHERRHAARMVRVAPETILGRHAAGKRRRCKLVAGVIYYPSDTTEEGYKDYKHGNEKMTVTTWNERKRKRRCRGQE